MGKLVRDKIDQIIKKSGKEPVIRILDEAEYKEELCKKLQEEVNEFLADNNIEELADILEVIYALTETIGKSVSELHACAKAKATMRGNFKDKKYLVEVK